MYKFYYFLITLFSIYQLGITPLIAQETKTGISYSLMNKSIKHALKEHERQTKMHDEEVKNFVKEEVNQWSWTKLKSKTDTIKSRLTNIANDIVPLLKTIVVSGLTIKNIKDELSKTYSLIKQVELKGITKNNQFDYLDFDNWYLGYDLSVPTMKTKKGQGKLFTEVLVNAYYQTSKIATDIKDWGQYAIGIGLNVDLIGQMEQTDRRMLLTYLEDQMKEVHKDIIHLNRTLRVIIKLLNNQKGNTHWELNRDLEIFRRNSKQYKFQ